MRKLLLFLAATALVHSAAGQPRPDAESLRKLRDEFREAEELRERFRRFIPDGFDLESEKRSIAAAAGKAELPAPAVRVVKSERLQLRDGGPSPIELHRVELTGTTDYDRLHFFLFLMRIRLRLLDEVRVEALPDRGVRYVARFTYPVWIGDDAAVPSTGDPATDIRRRIERARALIDGMASIVDRVMIEQAVDTFADFTRSVEERPVAVTSATIGDLVTIRGFVSGASARAAVESALDGAKLRPARIAWSPAGVCHAFTIETVPEQPAYDENGLPVQREYTGAGMVFDGASERFCALDRAAQPARKIVVGSASSAPLLRARGVEVVDLFSILNHLFGENFLLEPGLGGRVDIDVSADGKMDDLYSALARAGLHIGEPPLRRVSSRAVMPATETPLSGEPITVAFRDADLSAVLCLLKEVSGREIRLAPADDRLVGVFANELPVNVLVDALTPKRSSAAVDPCTLPGAPRSRLAVHRPVYFAETPVADVRLVAVALLSEPQAYVAVPSGAVHPLSVGQAFADGTVKTITADGITLSANGKDVPLALK